MVVSRESTFESCQRSGIGLGRIAFALAFVLASHAAAEPSAAPEPDPDDNTSRVSTRL